MFSGRVAKHRTGLSVEMRELSEVARGYTQNCRCLVFEVTRIGKRVRDASHRDLLSNLLRSIRGSEEGGAGDWQPVPTHHWVHFVLRAHQRASAE